MNLLEYFVKIRENFDNIKYIENFVADPYWGDTSNIPASWKHKDGRVYDPKLEYDPDSLYDDREDNDTYDSLKPLLKGFDKTKTTKYTDEDAEEKIEEDEKDALFKEKDDEEECSDNILDLSCNKNFKMMIWVLIFISLILFVILIVFIARKFMGNSKPVETVQPIQSVQPVQPAQPVQLVQPVEPVQPAQSVISLQNEQPRQNVFGNFFKPT